MERTRTQVLVAAAAVAVICLAATPTMVDWNQIKNKPPVTIVDARGYNYAAQTPGGTLTGSSPATVTLAPCPSGVNGTDTALRFYLSGGTGTAESVASTGTGTCTSGALTGTVTFTPTNSHSGAWTIRSSHAGIHEAIAANPYREIRLPSGTYTMRDCLTLSQNQSVILSGDTYDPAGTFGTQLNFASVSATSCPAAIIESDGTGYPIYPITLRNLLIVGNGQTTPLWSGVSLTNVTRVTLDHVMVSGFAAYGVATTNSFEVTLDGCNIQYSGRWGAFINGTSNIVRVSNSFFSFNGRSEGYGNLAITGLAAPSMSTPVLVEGNAFEVAGQSPFTTVTVSFGAFFSNISSLTFRGNYVEANLGGSPSTQVYFSGGITSLIDSGNLYNSAGSGAANAVDYGATVTRVKSFGDTFYGPTAVRIFEGSDLSTFDIGPDACFATSTECASHPRLLAIPTLPLASAPPSPVVSQQFYCTNCTTAATCTTTGSGHMATHNGSAWKCD